MFYFDEINGKQILKSDILKDANAFFTTRDICICDKGKPTTNSNLPQSGKEDIKNNKKIIADYLKISEKNLLSPAVPTFPGRTVSGILGSWFLLLFMRIKNQPSCIFAKRLNCVYWVLSYWFGRYSSAIFSSSPSSSSSAVLAATCKSSVKAATLLQRKLNHAADLCP